MFVRINDDVFRDLIIHAGSEVRTLRVGSVTDASVRIIADRCPHLERLMLRSCPLVTPTCLPSIASLLNLHDIFLDCPLRFVLSDLNWLQQQHKLNTSSRSNSHRVQTNDVLNDYRDECDGFCGRSTLMDSSVFPWPSCVRVFVSFDVLVAEDGVFQFSVLNLLRCVLLAAAASSQIFHV